MYLYKVMQWKMAGPNHKKKIFFDDFSLLLKFIEQKSGPPHGLPTVILTSPSCLFTEGFSNISISTTSRDSRFSRAHTCSCEWETYARVRTHGVTCQQISVVVRYIIFIASIPWWGRYVVQQTPRSMFKKREDWFRCDIQDSPSCRNEFWGRDQFPAYEDAFRMQWWSICGLCQTRFAVVARQLYRKDFRAITACDGEDYTRIATCVYIHKCFFKYFFLYPQPCILIKSNCAIGVIPQIYY